MRMLKPAFGGIIVAMLSACGGPAVNSEVAMNVPDGTGRISVLFQDFAPGTACSVATPEGVLTAAEMPGKIEYPETYRAAPVTCTHPGGARYDVDVNAVLPQAFRVAGLTARPDGTLAATVSTGDALVRDFSEDAVKKVR